MLDEWENAPINYSRTIGNHPWVMELRGVLNQLIDPLNEVFGGLVNDSLEDILNHAEDMKEFCKKVGITK